METNIKSLNFQEIMAIIGANLQAVRQRVACAAAASARPVHDIGLIAVSKGFDASAVAAAQAHGQHAFGESYVQEALDKIHGFARAPTPGSEDHPMSVARHGADVVSPQGPLLGPLEWHFIGPIQSNKTRHIAANFAWVHSIDSLKIAERLSAARAPQLPPLQVCLQVNIGGESTKRGVAAADALVLARAVCALPRLTLRGLMAIPPAGGSEIRQRAYFAELRNLKAEIVHAGIALDTLSMGMSDDLETAIAEGATLVRVGTAIFGPRPRPGL